MRNRTLVPLMVIAGLAAVASAGVPQSLPESEIPAYRLQAPGLATAGQPTPAALARLKEMGFKTVVNLRTEQEGAGEERAVVEAQGLRYVHVPVTADTLSMADAEAVQKILDDPTAAPVLLHCASSNRVGGVYALVQSRKGLAAEQALAAGAPAGLKSPAMVAATAPRAGPAGRGGRRSGGPGAAGRETLRGFPRPRDEHGLLDPAARAGRLDPAADLAPAPPRRTHLSRPPAAPVGAQRRGVCRERAGRRPTGRRLS